jgi:hypothetical protein
MILDQSKPFTSSLNYVFIKMINFFNGEDSEVQEYSSDLKSLLKKHIKFIEKKVAHSSVILSPLREAIKNCSDSKINGLHSKKVKNVQLTYLSMRQEIPKPLATYHPNIEDEFLPAKSSTWRREQKNTEKAIKKSTNKVQKEAVKELKKDTLIV